MWSLAKLHQLIMTGNKKDISEIILAWLGVVTSFITPFLPLLQFIAVCLAIAISIKQLAKPSKK
jgi:uncharacterized protein (DUF2062 family)